DESGQRSDHDPAGLGLPPRVDDRTTLAADVLVVPDPRLGIDRLADGAEEPERGHVVRARQRFAPLHERADRRRRGVEDRDFVTAVSSFCLTGTCVPRLTTVLTVLAGGALPSRTWGGKAAQKNTRIAASATRPMCVDASAAASVGTNSVIEIATRSPLATPL